MRWTLIIAMEKCCNNQKCQTSEINLTKKWMKHQYIIKCTRHDKYKKQSFLYTYINLIQEYIAET